MDAPEDIGVFQAILFGAYSGGQPRRLKHGAHGSVQKERTPLGKSATKRKSVHFMTLRRWTRGRGVMPRLFYY